MCKFVWLPLLLAIIVQVFYTDAQPKYRGNQDNSLHRHSKSCNYNSESRDTQQFRGWEKDCGYKRNDSRIKKDKKKRICERKYFEYVEKIFGSDTTLTADDIDDFDGRVLAEPGQYPHMTALGFLNDDESIHFKCGGSLISEYFVITAAHCTLSNGITPHIVKIGAVDLVRPENNNQPQLRNIRQIYNQPNYTDDLYYNDIALIEMEKPIDFTQFVRPIRLWTQSDIQYNTAYAMGYGSTDLGKPQTNKLTDLNMTLVPNEECSKLLPVVSETPNGVIESQICARDFALNRDTCLGDSGGPLQLNLYGGRQKRVRKHYYLIGITSYGVFCRSPSPSVYTRVSSFLDWIEKIVWPAEF